METKLRLISLLSSVLDDEGLRGLCEARSSSCPESVSSGISAFYRALVQSGQKTASDYLREKLLCAETVFSRAAAKGEGKDMYVRVDAELAALEEAILVSPQALREKLPQDCRALCPEWECGAFTLTAKDLSKAYARDGFGAVRLSPALLYDRTVDALVPVRQINKIRLRDLKEYREEKQAVERNTVAFLEGRPADNVLLYGDRGTGKSSTVHALLNEFASRGLRLLQLTKADIPYIAAVKEKLSYFPLLRFILFFDDLSFDEQDASYAPVKAALEGSLAVADNARIYVTTNRRHLIKESFSRSDEVHAADAREETLSLFDRFGLVVTFIAPDKREYISILQQILRDRGIDISDEQAATLAERYAIEKGGRSPRAAKQLADRIQCAYEK